MKRRSTDRCTSWTGAAATLLLVLGGAGPARAQIGTGWTEFFPQKTVQLRGAGARYTNEGGIETFSTQPGDERAEARIHDDHRTGTWQFEGYVNVEPGVEGGSVHQVFKFLMIVAYPDGGGELRQHSYQQLGATGAYNRWVRVNTIHDAGAGRADIYIDGTWRGMVRSASPGPDGWYHKYGIYNSSSTHPVVHWRGIHLFKDGKADFPGPVDGGSFTPDARSDSRPADGGGNPPGGFGGPGAMDGGGVRDGAGGAGGGTPDGGFGPPSGPRGSGGSGGAPPGGTGGTGGAPGGTGGAPGGTGGAPGSPSGEAPADDSSACSCRLGAAGGARPCRPSVFLGVAWLIRRRLRRGRR